MVLASQCAHDVNISSVDQLGSDSDIAICESDVCESIDESVGGNNNSLLDDDEIDNLLSDVFCIKDESLDFGHDEKHDPIVDIYVKMIGVGI